MKRTTALVGAAIGVVLAVSACGTPDSDDPTSVSESSAGQSADDSAADQHNDADVMFAQGMIPHHAQAVEMSDIVLAKDGVDEEVRSLAEEIKAAQAPEIELMSGWLEGWGEEVPATDGMDSMAGMDHSDSGMMSEEDMAALTDSDGAEASRLFLEQMIEHHQGAIAMAETELSDGSATEATELAQSIIDTQQAEIRTMEDLLADL